MEDNGELAHSHQASVSKDLAQDAKWAISSGEALKHYSEVCISC